MNQTEVRKTGLPYVRPAIRTISLDAEDGILTSSFVEVGGENTKPFDTQGRREESIWTDNEESIWK